MTNKKLLCILTMLLLVPALAWARGFHGGGFRGGFGGGRGGGFRGGVGIGIRGGYGGGPYYRGGYFGGGYLYGRPYYRSFRPYYSSFGPYYGYGYGYPGFGFYASFGYYDWPSYNYWPPSYVYYTPSYPTVVEREVARVRERNPDDYQETARTAPSERYWLIAFRDKSIQAVTDYWMEGSTLHFVSRDGTKSSADISNVDVSFTRELNRERGLDFRLPSSSGYQPRRLDSYGRPQ